ncbi:MAG TPA: tetratricopeptide repeat protein [Terriglobales bacterium]|nr:tetratricopeptide repeat protein [Terriglobales bacterium]
MKTSGMLFAALLLLAAPLLAQPSTPQDLVKQGDKLSREGKQDQALELYHQAMQASPNLYEAHFGAGAALDLKGEYTQARREFAKAIDLAPPPSKAQAFRAMAVSYAFQRDSGQAAKYEEQAFNLHLAAKDYTAAAETADELARIYLESGDVDNAELWYRRGHETAFVNKNMNPAEKDLWNFRWEHAQARIAARRGRHSEAEKHVAAAKTILDKGGNPNQQRFFPYLQGYVAFYANDYKGAIADLRNADQQDPFILALLAQACEKSGSPEQAMNYYRQILAINIHNPTNAFARPLAQQKLARATD